MMLDHLERMVRDANPVPDPAALDPWDPGVASATEPGVAVPERRVGVTAPRRGPLIGFAAGVAAVVLVGAAAWLARPSGVPATDEPPAETEAAAITVDEAVETAERWMEARNAHDLRTLMEMVAYETEGTAAATAEVAVPLMYDNSMVASGRPLVFDLGDVMQAFEVERLYDVRYEPFECEPGSGPLRTGGFLVDCTYLMDSRLLRMAGLPPVESAFELRVRAGGIDEMSFPWLTVGWEGSHVPAEFDGFLRWLEAEHPAAFPGPSDTRLPRSGTVFRAEGPALVHELYPRSVDILEGYLDEYETTVTGTGTGTITGLAGLPPEGAIPSTPEVGELVASLWEHIGAPGSFGNGWLYLYADGRLIWERLDPDPTGGWLERRLTPEGVELVRSEIIDTGLFDPDQPPPGPNDSFPREFNGGSIQVRNGERLVYINHVVPELFERVADLWSWLPEGAWGDAGNEAFVPSRYAVCMQDGGYVAPVDATEHISELPAAARDLLAGARQLDMGDLADLDPAGMRLVAGSTGSCFDIAVDGARSLAMILDDAGVERLPHRSYDGSEVTYVVTDDSDEGFTGPGFNGVTLTFWPMLPHGVPAFTGA